MQATERTDVVVVGGGIGGLATAALLARRGIRATVLEKSTQPGGRGVTHQLAGQRFNLGPHALYLGGHAKRILDELRVSYSGGAVRGEGGFARRGGKLHTLPAGPLSLLTTGLLGVSAKVELGRLLARIERIDTRPLAQVSLRPWVERTLGTDDARDLLLTLIRLSTYGADTERMSAGFALEQLRLGFAGVLYLDGGWQTLVDGLLAKLVELGAPVRTGARVERIVAAQTGWRIETSDVHLEAAAVVLACPPRSVRRLLEGTGASGLEALDQLVPIQAACLDIALDHLPKPKQLIALDTEAPLYASIRSGVARLATEGGAVLQLARYLVHEEGGQGAEAELESLADALQPGWRAHVTARRSCRR